VFTEGRGGKKKSKAKSSGNKQAAKLLKGIADEAAKKLAPNTPKQRLKTLDKAQAKTKQRVIEPLNRGAKPAAGPPKPSPERLKRLNAKDLFERAGENKGGKQRRFVDPLVVLDKQGKQHFAKGTGSLLKTQTRRDLETLADRSESPTARAKALTALQKSTNKDYRLPTDAELRRISDGTPASSKKKAKKKEPGAIEKLPIVHWLFGKNKGKGLAPVTKPLGKALGAGILGLQELNEIGDARGKAFKSSGIAPKLDVQETAKRGLYASGSAVLDALDRPLAGVESGVGKGLVELGAIKGDTAEKIRKARGPWKAFTKGRDWKKDVTGGDITGGLGVGREFGLGLDLALDPTMYVGLALAPATGGGSGALALQRAAQRVKMLDASRLESAAAVKALETFKKTRNAAQYAKALDALIPEEEVKALRATSSKKVFKKASDHRAENLIELNGKKHYVSGAGADAVAEAVKNIGVKGKKAQLRVNLMSPLGKVKGGANVPLTDMSGLPLPRAGKAYTKRLEAANEAKRAEVEHRAAKEIKELEDRIEAARHKAPKTKKAEAVRELKAKIKDIKMVRVPKELAVIDEKPAWTVADRLVERNTKKQAHAAMMAGGNFGRMTEQKFKRLRHEALKPIKGHGEEATLKRQRVQLAREIEQTTGSKADFLKLAPDEVEAMQQLQKVDDLQGVQSLQAATLDRLNPNYAGMRVYSQAIDRSSLLRRIDARIRPSTTSHQKHRASESMFELADPAKLALEVKKLARDSISEVEARQIVEQLHDTSLQRALSELHVRRLQRAEPVLWDDLTELERDAVSRSIAGGVGGKDEPLFHAPIMGATDTDGYVLPGNWDAYDIPGGSADPMYAYASLPNEEARRAAMLRDAAEDRAFVVKMRAASEGSRADDLDAVVARLDDEITELRGVTERDLPAAAVENVTDRVPPAERVADELKAPDPERKAIEKRQRDRDRRINKKQPVISDRIAQIDEELAAAPRAELAIVPDPEDAKRFAVADLNDEVGDPVVTGLKSQRAAEKWVEENGGTINTIAADREALLAEKAALTEKLDEFKTKLEASAVKAQTEIDDLMAARIEAQAKAVPAPEDDIVMEVSEDGGAWLKGADNTDEIPDELPPPRGDEPGPFEDHNAILAKYGIDDDIGARLPDARHGGLDPQLDPVVTGSARDRAQGISVGFAARWRGIDDVAGRHIDEAQASWRAADGTEGVANDLRPVRGQDGEITHYVDRRGIDEETGEALTWEPHEIEWSEAALIPNSEGSVWYDPITGAEYVRARPAFATDPQGIRIPETSLWPSRLVDHLKAQAGLHGETDTVFDSAVQGGIAKVTSSVRFGVTLPFPAYHMRNLYSDMVKSLQADAGVLFHPIVNAKLAKGAFDRGLGHTLDVPGYGKMEMADFLFLADMFGVRTGHQAVEINALLQAAADNPGKIKAALEKGVGKLGGVSGQREDIVRLQTFFQRLRANGGDAADAAWYMTRHHFDYSDLAAWERRFARNTFLFYTWYRKNIPLQLVELARRPGFMAGVSHTYQDLEAGETPLNLDVPGNPFAGSAPPNPARPDYVRDKLQAFTTSWNGHALDVGWGAPWADMGLMTWGEDGIFGNAGISMLSPVVSTPTLMALRRDPVTGRRWRGQEPSGAADSIQALSDLLGLGDLPTDEKGRPTLPWALSAAIRTTPFLGRALHTSGSAAPSKDQGRLQTIGRLTAPLTGLNISVAPEPGSTREELGIKQLILAEVVSKQRQAFIDYANLPDSSPVKKKALAKLKKEALEFIERKGIDKKYLKQVKQSGFYVGPGRQSSGFGGGLGRGGFSGGGL